MTLPLCLWWMTGNQRNKTTAHWLVLWIQPKPFPGNNNNNQVIRFSSAHPAITALVPKLRSAQKRLPMRDRSRRPTFVTLQHFDTARAHTHTQLGGSRLNDPNGTHSRDARSYHAGPTCVVVTASGSCDLTAWYCCCIWHCFSGFLTGKTTI